MISYVVQPGDSLYTLSNHFHTTAEEIMAANGLSSSTLYIGQTLMISDNTAAPTPGRSYSYTVQHGDTLYAIASQFGTTVDQIMLDNRLVSETLYAGQTLSVYAGTTTPQRYPPGPPTHLLPGQPQVQSPYVEAPENEISLIGRLQLLENRQSLLEARLVKLERRVSRLEKPRTKPTVRRG